MVVSKETHLLSFSCGLFQVPVCLKLWVSVRVSQCTSLQSSGWVVSPIFPLLLCCQRSQMKHCAMCPSETVLTQWQNICWTGKAAHECIYFQWVKCIWGDQIPFTFWISFSQHFTHIIFQNATKKPTKKKSLFLKFLVFNAEVFSLRELELCS